MESQPEQSPLVGATPEVDDPIREVEERIGRVADVHLPRLVGDERAVGSCREDDVRRCSEALGDAFGPDARPIGGGGGGG
ncbi:hypothetical protein ACFQL0_03945 [Haloplanus litoreus]|uniref:hypothetical protein n=1 Tax=Haloplanus litoreus TaxID=767515 RepID=UPI003609AA9B